jgi:hypothetical protein
LCQLSNNVAVHAVECQTLKGDVYLKTKSETLFECEFCKSLFRPHSSKQRFCTKDCRRLNGRQSPESRSCEFCKKEFIPTNARQRFCSGLCRLNGWRQPEQLRKNDWTDTRHRFKTIQFDGRVTGSDNIQAGSLDAFETKLPDYLERTIRIINDPWKSKLIVADRV